jgi:signal transduction histidine kinase
VLRDEEASGDLVGAEVLVEQEEHLHLPGGEPRRDCVGDAASEATALANAVEEPACDRAGESRLTARDAAEKLGNPLGRLALQKVARRTGTDRGEQVLLGARCREDDDLRLRRRLTDLRQGREAVHAGHREVEEDDVGPEARREVDGLRSLVRVADDVEAVLREQGLEGLSRQRMVVDDQDAFVHVALIGRKHRADEGDMQPPPPTRAEAYRSWLMGELVLVGLLGGATAYFGLTSALHGYSLPAARLALDTTVAVCATIVAILASVRFLVVGRLLDMLLASGFLATGLGTLFFAVLPVLGGRSLEPREAWAGLVAQVFAATMIAAAPFGGRRVGWRQQALAGAAALTAAALVGSWLVSNAAHPTRLTTPDEGRVFGVTAAFAVLALLGVVAVVGFGLRYRRHGRDLDSWLTLALTLTLFANLHYVLAPVLSSRYILQGDFLRLLTYGVLLVGVWRAISEAEFGRAVADERARVAREIHDGLAQYLFALSTQVSMLESGASLEELLPRMKVAATSAQQEARFAVLALSSASGTAPFDAALRRYVDFLTADGELDVELDIDPAVSLAPDEQIEIFRIVQEGLANVRHHAGARRALVTIGRRAGRRVVRVEDDGRGFEETDSGAGQGLQNMRRRVLAIEGGFRLLTAPGRGTAVEVTLRG